MILPVVGEGLVELPVLLVADVIRRPRPDGLRLIQLLVLGVLLLDLLFLLLVLVLLVLVLVVPDVLNLGLLLLLLFLLLLGLGLVVRDLLLPLLLDEEADGIADELRVLLYNLFDFLLLQVLSLVLLKKMSMLGIRNYFFGSLSDLKGLGLHLV